MLRSSQPVYLKVDRSPDGSELDHRHKLQMKLLVMCRRYCTYRCCLLSLPSMSCKR